VGNEGNQQSQPWQGSEDEQGHFGWRYDQDATQIAPPRQPKPASPISQSPPSPNPQPAAPAEDERTLRYQQPIRDMGMTLGYGQGTEYQYVNVPQPSQPIAQLRQERLQQLREERMRRQQRRMQPDATVVFPWRNKEKRTGSLLNRQGSVSSPLPSGALPSGELSPAEGEDSITPVRYSTAAPPNLQIDHAANIPGNNELQSAASSAQDTGMIQKMRIGRAASILTIAYVLSRVLGLVRTSMFAYVFGTSAVSDAYLQAFLIPDFIFNIVAGGALSSAFIPVFTNYMIGENNAKKAWHVASAALNLALTIMVAFAAIAIIFARQLVPLYNPGESASQLDLIASLTRVMLLQSIVLGGGVIVTSVLNAKQDFKLPAIGTVLYNVGLIVGLLPGAYFALSGHHNDQFAVYAATWGVVLGAIFQVGIQIFGLFQVKMQYSFTLDWRDPGILQIARQMLPRILNSAMVYMSIFVDRSLILLLIGIAGVASVGGLITQYYQASQLMLLPYGIFGLSLATAAFPSLAENVTRGRFDRMVATILETLRNMLFMSIPSSVGLIVLGLPIIQVLLQHGLYYLKDAQSTAVPLAFFAVGLPALCAVEILTRSFYAMRDTRTPVIISILQFILKIAVSLVLINIAAVPALGTSWGMGALAFSTSLANISEAIALFILLRQRIPGLSIRPLAIFLGRVLTAAGAMAVGLIVVRLILDRILNTTGAQTMGLIGTFEAMIKLVIEIAIGITIYGYAAKFLHIEEVSSLDRFKRFLGPVKRVMDRLKLSSV
jgi:putative peptidoglycan lipid II flippase